MSEMENYLRWKKMPLEDMDLMSELAAIDGDIDSINDRFYKNLEFGTGGLRGVIGAGTNRMNIYTIRKATQGLALYLLEQSKMPSVAISYDSRIKSDVFAKEAARVLAGNGVKVYIYDKIMPTPCLSFAVRKLSCDAGIMVTASHNPAKYNGYKAYGSDGCQMTIEAADIVLNLINNVDIFGGIRLDDFDTAISDGSIEYIKDSVYEEYINCVNSQLIHDDIISKSNLKVVYTPLNGTGNLPVRHILDIVGVKDVVVVKEQEYPDGTFKTCPFPNPEIAEALKLGLELSNIEKPDLLLATDPDCDRVGIAIPDKNGEYKLVSGNEVGALLLHYICEQKTKNNTLPKNPLAVKTIVSTELATKICEDYNVEIIDVLTGFKFIGEQILNLEKLNQEDRFIFGFEESYGYLSGTYVRDKDAVVASMLICEVAAFYKNQGLSLLDAINSIYNKYGLFLQSQESFTLEGKSGMQKMMEIMTNLRETNITDIGGFKVIKFCDYYTQMEHDYQKNTKNDIKLPKSDVLCYYMENGSSVILRPSGTEPKIKAYYSVVENNIDKSKETLSHLSKEFVKLMNL